MTRDAGRGTTREGEQEPLGFGPALCRGCGLRVWYAEGAWRRRDGLPHKCIGGRTVTATGS